MITASIDAPKLAKSIKRFSKEFGDTNRDCVCRIAINVARQEAFQVQPYGKSADQKRMGEMAIESDYNKCVSPLGPKIIARVRAGKSLQFGGEWYRVKSNQVLDSVKAIRAFVQTHRSNNFRVGGRLPKESRGFAPAATFKQSLKAAKSGVGKAKGSIIDAGNDVVRLMKRKDAKGIGKAFIRWAQRHKKAGRATGVMQIFSPDVILRAERKHMKYKRVYNPSNNFDQAVKNVLKWYKKSVEANDKKAA